MIHALTSYKDGNRIAEEVARQAGQILVHDPDVTTFVFPPLTGSVQILEWMDACFAPAKLEPTSVGWAIVKV